jgi:hypothetical protein
MDIIANDPGGPAGSWGGGVRLPRWARAAAFGTAMVSLLGYVATHRLGSTDAAAAWQAPVLAAAATRSGPAGALTGRPGYGPLGLRMLFGGTDPRVVDLDTGGEHPVNGIPRPTGSMVFLSAMRGALVANVMDSGLFGAYLVQTGQPARRLSTTGYALPSLDGSTVIVFEFRRLRGMVVTGQRIDGHRRWEWTGPAIVPVADTAAGLLVRQTDSPGGMLLVRRDTGQILRRLSTDPLAEGDDSVVTAAPECRPHCTLIRTRLDTGTTTKFGLPVDQTPDYGVISPGGRWLALGFRAAVGESGTTVAVLDLRTGAFWPVPGVWAPAPVDRRRAGLAWTADAASLVVAVRSATTSVQVGIWRPDVPLEPVTVLPRHFTGAPLGLATLP